MTFMGVPDNEPESEQTKEIREVLEAAPAKDEWASWEYQIQAQVDKLIAESRTMKIATFAIGGVALAGLAASAAMGRVVQQLMAAVGQLGENQLQIANAIGLGPTPRPSTTLDDMEKEYAEMVMDNRVEDIHTVDIDPNAVVGKPFEGPATEASEAAKKQLAEDKAAGIIDLAKETDEPT